MRNKPRILAFASLFAFALLAVQAQEFRRPRSKPSTAYTVAGLRHGVSFFPRVDYPMTRPKAEGQIDFGHYHRLDEVNAILTRWAKDFPNLVDLYSVGKSFEGRDIWQMTITNKATGKDTDKPAMFIEGNRHSGEVTAAESALWFAWHILSSYGKDPEMTRLVDTKTLYVKVKNNPDGSELYLNTALSNRSTVRPTDDDGDGLLDEDPTEDLDGDGFVLQMRKKVEPGKGQMAPDPDDKSGRLMKRTADGKGDYVVYSEGVDSDADGAYNEDGVGGLDLHRNYVENWRPMPGRDLTGRGWTQGGAGDYPLSETETRAVVVFLLEHPNVSVGQTMDTSIPMLLHGPSTSLMDEAMFPEDLKLYRYFDQEGKKITGYARAGDAYYDYSSRDGGSERPASGNAPQATPGARVRSAPPAAGSPAERRGSPMFGHSPDFGYLYYGAIWYGDELWCGGRVKDYDGDGRVTELEMLRTIDEDLGGKYFTPWHKFNHPQLGEVEIGGFNPKFWSQNPPPELLEEWIKKEAMFNLFLAGSLPQVKIVSARIEPSKKEAETYVISAVFTNEGLLPTALKMADRVKIVRPDAVQLDLPEGLTLAGDPSRRDIGYLQSKEKKEIRWRLKGKPQPGAEAEIMISSTRGGVEKMKLKLAG